MKKFLIIALLFSAASCVMRHYSADDEIDSKHKSASGRINNTEFNSKELLKTLDE